MLVIQLVQLAFIVSVVGSVVLLVTVLGRMGIGRTPQRDAALWAYAATLLCGAFLAGRAEIKWRKSFALDDKTLISSRQQDKN